MLSVRRNPNLYHGSRDHLSSLPSDLLSLIVLFLDLQSSFNLIIANKRLNDDVCCRQSFVVLLGQNNCKIPFIYSRAFFLEIKKLQLALYRSQFFMTKRWHHDSFLATILKIRPTPENITKLFFSMLTQGGRVCWQLDVSLSFLAKFFIKHLDKTPIRQKCLRSRLQTLLGTAAACGFNDLIQLFVQCGAHVKAPCSVRILGRRVNYDAITLAALRLKITRPKKNPIKTIALLMRLGSSLNKCCNINRETPLYWAAYSGNRELCLFLIQHKAHVNVINRERETPLIAAVTCGHRDVAELLLQQPSIDIDAQDSEGTTALMQASWKQHVSIVKLLLNSRADIRKTDNDGLNALHYAVWTKGNTSTICEIFELLITSGIAVDSEDNEGMTPLMYSAKRVPELISPIIVAGASVTKQDHKGNTAFHYAEHPESILTLLSHQADYEVTNNDGLTPLEFLDERGFEESAHALSQYIMYEQE